ncbi:alpha/beta hydrolase [Thalassomonas viridans]|uniref:Alpha/beta hydrolase n=1 Tax=Thalassomonas viridans TaxID=137584 RepID=A0AAE9Z853_9GAMM|nr:alpha/beta hydrolase [Thalassomonas viridans]WDE07914.1 alpha/beta hydrolase [Thalassomonas viridans]
MKLSEWLQKGKQFSYRGHNIFYRDEGQGEVLLLIHGFPTACWDWHKLWPGLTEGYRVVCLDMIGFGFSDKPRKYNYSIFDQADLHQAFLAHLGISQVHILAHDYGDTVAQELLARFQDGQSNVPGENAFVINSLCLLNGGLFPETHRPLLLQKLLLSPVGKLISYLSNEKTVRKKLNGILAPDKQLSNEEWQDFWTLIKHNRGQEISYKLIRYMQERKINRERWVGALTRASVPVRLINGSLDPISGVHMVTRYFELMPETAVDVVALDEVGHYPQVEDPEAVLKAYLAFIPNEIMNRSPSMV